MKQKITGFHTDEDNHWVADLQCGHKQHVRHDPPFHPRDWVTSSEERQKKKGSELNCKRCDEVGLVVAQFIQKVAIQTLKEAELDSAAAAMCGEGQIELALDRIKTLDLKALSQKAIAEGTGEFGTLTKDS